MTHAISTALTQDHIKNHDPNKRQAMAANPETSAWVSASAGTGKTKILTDRVLRLMLPMPNKDADISYETNPDKILCLTYTKTAASEMGERISMRLSEWAVMNDKALVENLTTLIGTVPNEEIISAARSLFARVVDIPGGMKIMTIHSFCQSILKRFPLEAGLPAHFEVLDDRTTSEYLARAERHVIAEIKANPNGTLAESFETLSTEINADQFSDLMRDISGNRQIIKSITTRFDTAEALKQEILKHLDCDDVKSENDLLLGACTGTAFNEEGLKSLLDILFSGGKNDAKLAESIASFLEKSPEHRVSHFQDYARAFLTQKNEIRKKLCSKGVSEKIPNAEDILYTEATRVLAVMDKVKSFRLAKFTYDILNVGQAIVTAYEKIKSSHIQLDYDDLIFYTARLLSNSDQAGWVLYKMDRGIDHILVDEAQDTSPDQWTIIKAIAEDFFSGTSARDDAARTIFVVGDEKQSIFSFQGADPRGFKTMRDHFQDRIQSAERSFTPVNLLMSFRSTPAVLKGVDHIFSSTTVREGVQNNAEEEMLHLPFRENDAGLVEVWPLIPSDIREEIEPWTPPIHITSTDTADVRLAFKIADTIADWLHTGQRLKSKDRPIKAGDIMILFRRRSKLLDHIVRALKYYNVPISGVDRMVLTDHLAVQDCLIAAECALMPEDDLSLATFLKSPFIGYDEDKLFDLAFGRSRSLWSALKDYDFDTYAYIMGLVKNVQTHTPYVFFQKLLVEPTPTPDKFTGRKALFARLGLEIDDAIGEFLNLCIDFERLHIPHMQTFLYWFRQGQSEVKREQEGAEQDQVRLMTVHASKGLQAPIVFLPDTTSLPNNSFNILWPAGDTKIPLWAPRAEHRDPHYNTALEHAKAKQDEEYRRLLYVALTRAEDRLYICGARGRSKPADNSWYSLCFNMLSGMNNVQTVDFDIGGDPVIDHDTGEVLNALRYETEQTKAVEKKKTTEQTLRRPKAPLPDWAYAPPAAEPVPPKPLAPSRPSDLDPAIRSPLDADDNYRFARGNIVHYLLEVLPQLPADKQENACRKYLVEPAHELKAPQQDELAKEIFKVLRHTEFAPIFGPNSRAEVPIVGLISKHDAQEYYAISGQIDRMLVEKDRVLVVDYKTNRPPPTDPKDVPNVYRKQLLAYKTALCEIYPDKKIECALLWTDGPNLMPIDV